MERNDQMPSSGCEICGAYAGEPQAVLRTRLVRVGNAWICEQCRKKQEA